MRRFFSAGSRLILACLATGWISQAHAIPWIERHGITSASLQNEYDQWTAAPYKYRMTRLCGSESSGQARYTVVFEQSPKTTLWAARSGMTATAFRDYHDDIHAVGYRLVWLDGFEVGSTAYYNGIWELTQGPTQRLRLGESLANHLVAHENNVTDGFHRVDIGSFSVGDSSYHFGVWAAGRGVETEVRHGMTSSVYQDAFNELGGDGWRIHRVNGYTVAGAERFSALWKRTGVGDGWSYHGMAADDFVAHHTNATYQGYRPVYIDPYNVGTSTRYNATWIRNGGLSTARLGAISTPVVAYMTARNLPGLSLAIAHQGRLVYARGFGYADTGSGDLAHALHRWRLASVSKPVCAVAVLRALEDSAAWSLDSRCFGSGALFGTDYGDTAANPYSTRERAITIRHLLNMTAGWNTEGNLWYNSAPGYGTNHKLIIDDQLDLFPQVWDVASVYDYNNFNYQVAARVPEKITGMLFEDYCEQEIFEPCGMTSFAMGARTAAGRLPGEVAYYEGNQWGSPENVWPARMDGSTAWTGRPSDLLLMARRIDGNPRQSDIIGSYALSQMQLASGVSNSTYGFGWYPTTRHGRTWWQHNGAMAGSKAILVVSDDGEMAFAYATNSVHSDDWPSGGFRDLILDEMDAIDDAGAWPTIDLSGTYNPVYDAWATGVFGSTVTAKTSLADVFAPHADPDGDERCNALEAYLGSDPTSFDRASWANLILSDTHLTVRWTKRNGDRGVVATPQWSVTMTGWPNGLTGVVDRPDLITLIGHTVQEAQLARAGLRARYWRLGLTTP